MRQFVIDELSPMERDNIDSYLKRNLVPGPMIGLYWVELPDRLLSETQQEHSDHGPFHLAVEVTNTSVRFELLVRSQVNLHCKCIAHATAPQRQHILEIIDRMLEEEMIRS